MPRLRAPVGEPVSLPPVKGGKEHPLHFGQGLQQYVIVADCGTVDEGHWVCLSDKEEHDEAFIAADAEGHAYAWMCLVPAVETDDNFHTGVHGPESRSIKWEGQP